MPEYGEVAFTLSEIRVAPLLSNGTYGTSVALDYGQKLSFEPQADTDQIKAYGMIVERLAVTTHATGSLDQGLVDFDAYAVMIAGLAASSSETGSSPNKTTVLEHLVGDAGLPYFGLIGRLAALRGAGLHLGFRKCMLDKVPGFTVDQNKFILPSTTMTMITSDVTTRQLLRLKRLETNTAIPVDFNTFFA